MTRNKQTVLGQEIRFAKSFRRSLFMALDFERRGDIRSPLRSQRVLSRNQAKSEIYDLRAFSLPLSWNREKQTKRETISVTFSDAPKTHSFGVIIRETRTTPENYFARILLQTEYIRQIILELFEEFSLFILLYYPLIYGFFFINAESNSFS